MGHVHVLIASCAPQQPFVAPTNYYRCPRTHGRQSFVFFRAGMFFLGPQCLRAFNAFVSHFLISCRVQITQTRIRNSGPEKTRIRSCGPAITKTKNCGTNNNKDQGSCRISKNEDQDLHHEDQEVAGPARTRTRGSEEPCHEDQGTHISVLRPNARWSSKSLPLIWNLKAIRSS